MNTYIKKQLLLIMSMGFLISCDSFLDEIPDNRTEIDTPEKIGELLAGAYPESSYFMIAESMSDNATDIGPASTSDIEINSIMYYWEDTNLTSTDTPTHYWNACYKAIAQANHALEIIEGMEKENELNAYRGEAMVARAYAHFMLVTLWGKAYDPATASTDLGVPIVTEPETKVLKEYSRASVQEVYDQIEQDLLNGLPLLSDNYEQPKFHFTPHAAYAFASRFFQFKGDWEKVIEYTSMVLEGNPARNLRDWPYYRTLQPEEIRQRHQSSEEPTNLLVVGARSLYARNFASGRYGVDYDLRHQYYTGTHPLSKTWAYGFRVYSSTRYFLPKYREYFKYTNINAGIGYAYAMNVLFTYDEVLLNRAEAYVMRGRYDDAVDDINAYLSKKTMDYDAANDIISRTDLEAFYANRISPDEFDPFYSISEEQLPLLKCVIDSRQREFLHEGIRWLDHKRLGMDVLHYDNQGNEYVLTKEDNRRMLQIPEIAVTHGLEANPR